MRLPLLASAGWATGKPPGHHVCAAAEPRELLRVWSACRSPAYPPGLGKCYGLFHGRIMENRYMIVTTSAMHTSNYHFDLFATVAGAGKEKRCQIAVFHQFHSVSP